MSDFLKVALPALLALAGTLTALVVGYRQWKRQQAVTRFGSTLTERLEAYKTAWQKVEEAHIFIRTPPFDKERFAVLVRDANVHMLRAGLVLDPKDRDLVNTYLSSLERLGQLLAVDEASGARELARATLDIPPVVLQGVRKLEQAYATVETSRAAVIERFRDVLGAQLVF